MLPTVDHKVAIDTSAECRPTVNVLSPLVSIDTRRRFCENWSTGSDWRPICRSSLDGVSIEMSIEYRSMVNRESIDTRSRCRSRVSIDTRSRMPLVHMIQNNWPREFFFYLHVKRDRLDFCVNVNGFWCLHVTREKANILTWFNFPKGYRGSSESPWPSKLNDTSSSERLRRRLPEYSSDLSWF